ncbi:hypothetical protein JT358_01160 [Micrococcales bacterium 31B]|nr:hypothetical protein [Micrococcales bacterium 31B]
MSDSAQQLSREDLVAQAISSWRDEFEVLTDVPSLRQHIRAGFPYLDITTSHPAGLAKLMAQGTARLSEVVREAAAQTEARHAAAEIHQAATHWAQEYGLFTTYLSIGEATWVPLDGRESPVMPVLVRAAELSNLGAARHDLNIALHSAVEVNPELLRALHDVGIHLDPEELVEMTQGSFGLDPLPAINALRALGEPLPGFTVRQRLVLTNIVDVGQALLDELSTGAYRLQRHPVIAAIAGDTKARHEVRAKTEPLDHATLRELEDHLIVDADPDAARALNLARAGSHVAITAPRGTQRVETILNLVATQIAAGKKVLLVSPQRSTLEDLHRRAAELDLDRLLLDLGPTPQSQLEARASLAESLAEADYDVDVPPEPLAELHRCAKLLNDHARAVRTVNAEIGVSLLDCLEALARLTAAEDAPSSQVIIHDQHVPGVSRQRAQLVRLLLRASELGAFEGTIKPSPWDGSTVRSAADTDNALVALRALQGQHLPQVRQVIEENGPSLGLAPVETLADLEERLDLVDSLRDTLMGVRDEAFAQDPHDLIAATATKEWRQERGIDQSMFLRRKLVRQAQALAMPGAEADLHVRLLEVSALRERWRAFSTDGSTPRLPHGLGHSRAAFEVCLVALRNLAGILPQHDDGGGFKHMTFDEIDGLIAGLLAEQESLVTLTERNELVARLDQAGLRPLCEDFRTRSVSADRIDAEFTLVWWSSAMQYIVGREESLEVFTSRDLIMQVAHDFRTLDEQHIKNGKFRVLQTARTLLRAAIEEHGQLDESGRRTLLSLQRTSLRDLLVRFAPVLTAVRPCWLVSPYLVPQLVPTRVIGQLEKPMFDVVILADVGQMSDAAAVAAMSRAHQVIAIGDPHQVVPGHLNRRVAARSALDTCREILPHIALTRSNVTRSGSVQEFVQSHLFAGEMSCVPSPFTGDADQIMFVNDRGGAQISPDGVVESSQSELQLLGSIILQHAKYFSDKSLAVVTFTESHAARVMEHVLHRVALRGDVAPFFDPSRPEPFVVVAAAHAGSLERDSVIVSVGFTKSPHRRVVYRMGPLTSENGREALAVALTRARANTLVISALRGSDLDPEKIRYRGLADLKTFLEFMELRYAPDPVDEPAAPDGAEGAPAVPTDAPADALGDNDPTVARTEDAGADAGTEANEASASETPETRQTPETPETPETPADVAAPGLHEPVVAEPVAAPTAREDISTTAHRVRSGSRSPHLSDLDPLLSEVADRLWFAGLIVETEFGEGDERIALALGSQRVPGRMLVAVEPDTRVRPLSRSVRERDRLRLERLERAGWQVERLWAWPLFLDPKGEAERLRALVESLADDVLAPPAPPEPLPAPVVVQQVPDRGPKPMVPDNTPLSELSEGLWDRMLQWIMKDEVPRLEEELANELRREMGFTKRGVHIDISVYSTIRRYQASLDDEAQRTPPYV